MFGLTRTQNTHWSGCATYKETTHAYRNKTRKSSTKKANKTEFRRHRTKKKNKQNVRSHVIVNPRINNQDFAVLIRPETVQVDQNARHSFALTAVYKILQQKDRKELIIINFFA